MKNVNGLILFTILFTLITELSAQQSVQTLHPFLAGDTPGLFAPELFNNPEGYHSPPVFMPDGSEAYFSPMTKDSKTMILNYTGEKWSAPREINFGLDEGVVDPCISPDGKRLYFLSFKTTETDSVARERIWYVEKTELGWSEPVLIDLVVRDHRTHWTFSVANNYNLYFTSESGNSQDIYFSEYKSGAYLLPVSLGENINTPYKEFCPYISPDEDYIIFSRIGKSTSKSDLFISFKTSSNTWSHSKPLGERVNSNGHDLAATITPDTNYMFFLSTRNGASKIYWINTSFIDSMRVAE